jgi:hypothetical protein
MGEPAIGLFIAEIDHARIAAALEADSELATIFASGYTDAEHIADVVLATLAGDE